MADAALPGTKECVSGHTSSVVLSPMMQDSGVVEAECALGSGKGILELDAVAPGCFVIEARRLPTCLPRFLERTPWAVRACAANSTLFLRIHALLSRASSFGRPRAAWVSPVHFEGQTSRSLTFAEDGVRKSRACCKEGHLQRRLGGAVPAQPPCIGPWSRRAPYAPSVGTGGIRAAMRCVGCWLTSSWPSGSQTHSLCHFPETERQTSSPPLLPVVWRRPVCPPPLGRALTWRHAGTGSLKKTWEKQQSIPELPVVCPPPPLWRRGACAL